VSKTLEVTVQQLPGSE
jgi:serine protease Do